jgi:hypothetical protein
MIANTTKTTTTRKPGTFSRARKLLLALGGLAVAGSMMAATPAMAHDRYEGRRDFDRHEFRHDYVRREFVPAIVCDPLVVTDQIWVPARYELETRWVHGHEFTERVCVEPGHWVCR